MLITIMAMRPVPRLAQRPPEAAVDANDPVTIATRDGDRGGHQHGPAEGDVEEEGDDRPEGDHLAVGEVHQSGRAEDQRQADGAHGDDQAEADALDAEAHEALEIEATSRPPPPGGRTRTARPGRARRSCSKVRVVRSSSSQRDALGQRVGVDRDGVRPGPRQRHLALTILVGCDGVDLLAVGTLDGDVHALGDGLLARSRSRSAASRGPTSPPPWSPPAGSCRAPCARRGARAISAAGRARSHRAGPPRPSSWTLPPARAGL